MEQKTESESDEGQVTVKEKALIKRVELKKKVETSHDVAVAVPATAKEASVPASTSTPPVQREQSVHLILLIFHLLYSCFSF